MLEKYVILLRAAYFFETSLLLLVTIDQGSTTCGVHMLFEIKVMAALQ